MVMHTPAAVKAVRLVLSWALLARNTAPAMKQSPDGANDEPNVTYSPRGAGGVKR